MVTVVYIGLAFCTLSVLLHWRSTVVSQQQAERQRNRPRVTNAERRARRFMYLTNHRPTPAQILHFEQHGDPLQAALVAPPPPPVSPRQLRFQCEMLDWRRLLHRFRTIDLIFPLYDHGDDAICSICYDDLPSAKVLSLPCGHQFHEKCVSECRLIAVRRERERGGHFACYTCRHEYTL